MLTVFSSNCWFSFLRVHEKRLSFKEKNQFFGFTTTASSATFNKHRKICKIVFRKNKYNNIN